MKEVINQTESTPKLSIICTAYNQESFINQCLDGFLMQKTNFSFEIIISDDASTDNTAKIIKGYELKYPELFKCFYHHENLHSQKINFSDELYGNAKGKYIALCEGDDCWIDSLKLQKQVDFLEKNEDFGMVHTNYKVVDDNNEDIQKFNRNWPSGNVFDRIINGKYNIVTGTVVFRTKIYKKFQFELEKLNFKMGDLPMWIEFSRISKVKYINEITTSYRQLLNSASHSNNIQVTQKFYENTFEIKLYYCNKYNLSIDKKKSLASIYGLLVKECYNKKEPILALKFYKKMILINYKSVIKPIPFFFMLGTKYPIFRKLINKLYSLNSTN